MVISKLIGMCDVCNYCGIVVGGGGGLRGRAQCIVLPLAALYACALDYCCAEGFLLCTVLLVSLVPVFRQKHMLEVVNLI